MEAENDKYLAEMGRLKKRVFETFVLIACVLGAATLLVLDQGSTWRAEG